MKSRLRKAVAALMMLVVFSVLVVLVVIPACAIGTLLWLLNGSEKIYVWVKKAGKSLDQCCNTLLPNGHPKETISSHVGRWILAEQEGRVRAPIWAHALNWVLHQFDDNHALDAIEEPFKGIPLQR